MKDFFYTIVAAGLGVAGWVAYKEYQEFKELISWIGKKVGEFYEYTEKLGGALGDAAAGGASAVHDAGVETSKGFWTWLASSSAPDNVPEAEKADYEADYLNSVYDYFTSPSQWEVWTPW